MSIDVTKSEEALARLRAIVTEHFGAPVAGLILLGALDYATALADAIRDAYQGLIEDFLKRLPGYTPADDAALAQAFKSNEGGK